MPWREWVSVTPPQTHWQLKTFSLGEPPRLTIPCRDGRQLSRSQAEMTIGWQNVWKCCRQLRVYDLLLYNLCATKVPFNHCILHLLHNENTCNCIGSDLTHKAEYIFCYDWNLISYYRSFLPNYIIANCLDPLQK